MTVKNPMLSKFQQISRLDNIQYKSRKDFPGIGNTVPYLIHHSRFTEASSGSSCRNYNSLVSTYQVYQGYVSYFTIPQMRKIDYFHFKISRFMFLSYLVSSLFINFSFALSSYFILVNKKSKKYWKRSNSMYFPLFFLLEEKLGNL